MFPGGQGTASEAVTRTQPRKAEDNYQGGEVRKDILGRGNPQL